MLLRLLYGQQGQPLLSSTLETLQTREPQTVGLFVFLVLNDASTLVGHYRQTVLD